MIGTRYEALKRTETKLSNVFFRRDISRPRYATFGLGFAKLNTAQVETTHTWKGVVVVNRK